MKKIKRVTDSAVKLNIEALIECIGLLVLVAVVPLFSNRSMLIAETLTVVVAFIFVIRFFKAGFYSQSLIFTIIALMSSVIFFM